jgi:hypothetical protein
MMPEPIEQRLSRLRGQQPAEEPGARGIERVARNPECLRLRAITIAGMTPAKVANRVLGLPDREGQSPFALTMGQRFERRLIEHGAANLFALYRERGLLGIEEAKIVALDQLAAGSTLRARRQRESETTRLLVAKLRGDPLAPNLIIKPRLCVDLVGLSHPIEPDFLVAADADPFYRVGEMKSYPDRDGKTDAADIRGACRQAAVGVVGLRQTVRALSAGTDVHPIAACDLILRVTGMFTPTLRQMTIAGEVDSIERALAEAPTSLNELEAMLPRGTALDDPNMLSSIPNNYRSACKEYCAMWAHCRGQALAASDPVILGDMAAEQLAAAGSVERALDLMNGVGRPPRNAAEAALAAQLRLADQSLQGAVTNG